MCCQCCCSPGPRRTCLAVVVLSRARVPCSLVPCSAPPLHTAGPRAARWLHSGTLPRRAALPVESGGGGGGGGMAAGRGPRPLLLLAALGAQLQLATPQLLSQLIGLLGPPALANGPSRTVHGCNCMAVTTDHISGTQFEGCGPDGWCDVGSGCIAAHVRPTPPQWQRTPPIGGLRFVASDYIRGT